MQQQFFFSENFIIISSFRTVFISCNAPFSGYWRLLSLRLKLTLSHGNAIEDMIGNDVIQLNLFKCEAHSQIDIYTGAQDCDLSSVGIWITHLKSRIIRPIKFCYHFAYIYVFFCFYRPWLILDYIQQWFGFKQFIRHLVVFKVGRHADLYGPQCTEKSWSCADSCASITLLIS